jgi:phage terminase large subunit-like protein
MVSTPKSGVSSNAEPVGKARARSDSQAAPIRPGREPKREQVRRFDRAERVIAFIGHLTVPSGVGQGKPFVLDEFQKEFIRDIYAEYAPHWQRRVRRAILSIARKNGKTALIAALVLVHLVGPEAIPNGEIYSVANDRDQAAQVYKVAAQIVRADPELSKMLRCIDSTKTITFYGHGSFYRAISSEVGTKHGLNPSLFIYDELAQARNRDLYDVMDTSQGARLEPLGIVISTQSNDPNHPLSQLIDDALSANDPTVICHLYAVPDDEPDIFDPEIWKKANPALGTFRSREDFEAVAARAKRARSFENTFRNLYLNQRVQVMSTLFSKSDWMELSDPGIEFEDGEEVLLSLDLAGTTDLACLGMISIVDAKYQTWFWKPEDTLREHARRDRVPYVQWHQEGLLEVSHGRIIDPEDIARKIAELNGRYKVLGLVYDRWRIDYLRKELDRADVASQEGEGPGLCLFPWGQGFMSMSPAIEALESLVLEGNFRHPGSDILNLHIASAVVVKDPAGGRKFDKAKSRLRIDGAVALAMAAGKRAQFVEVKPEPKYQMFIF